MLCVIAGLLVATTSPVVITQSKAQVGIIGWRSNGKLLYHVGDQLREWPSGRTAALPKKPENVFGSAVIQNVQEPGGDRWLINGRIFDAHAFKFGPPVAAERDNPFWAGGSVGHMVTSEDEHRNQTAWIVHKGQKRKLDGAWCYQAISSDGLYLAATREPLLGTTDLYILKHDPRNGSVKPMRKYLKAVDDHREPIGPAWNATANTFLITLCGAVRCWTLLGRTTLKPIETRAGWSSYSGWIDPKSPLFLSFVEWETGQSVTMPTTRFPVRYKNHSAVVLRSALTGSKQTLLEAAQSFVIPSYGGDSTIQRGSTKIKDADFDLARRRLAYVITVEESATSGTAIYEDGGPRHNKLIVKDIRLQIK